jgi:hypothetical protein
MAKKFYQFDPVKLARYEKENYVFYYQRRWLKLLLVSVLMIKEAYQLSLFQAIYGAYLIARAEIAFAPHPNNNLPLASSYIRRFYQMLGRVYRWEIDLDEAVTRELNWWIVHRKLFAVEQNQELVDALADVLVLVYRVDAKTAYQAAEYRAKGMLFSDQWVRQGLNPNSPLLAKEEEMLCKSYILLKNALIQKA